MRKLDDTFRQQGFYETSHVFYAGIQLITASLLVAAGVGLKYFGHTVSGVLVSALFLALFFQQSGWLAHDYAHSQVFKSSALNNIGGLIWGPCAQGLSVCVFPVKSFPQVLINKQNMVEEETQHAPLHA